MGVERFGASVLGLKQAGLVRPSASAAAPGDAAGAARSSDACSAPQGLGFRV